MLDEFFDTVDGEIGSWRCVSVRKFNLLRIVLNIALCASKIFVFSFALLLICSMVASTFSILLVAVPRADATPVADAITSALSVMDLSLLILMASRRRWTCRGMEDSTSVLTLDLVET